ncbi:hypothetical protein BGX31_010966 [Mortierella sp. GBA43]|nr:hypothetical protein BGX31_010966 [Mortierella sp. GBA43]
MHAYGTNIEGEWDDVCRVMKECHEAVHNMGCPRVSTRYRDTVPILYEIRVGYEWLRCPHDKNLSRLRSVRIGTRTDKVGQTIQDKVRVVQEILANDSK